MFQRIMTLKITISIMPLGKTTAAAVDLTMPYFQLNFFFWFYTYKMDIFSTVLLENKKI